MAWQDFIAAVNGGDTGTYDPAAAGLAGAGGAEGGWTEPLLARLIRSGALSNGISGPPPESARINAALPAPPPIPTQAELPQAPAPAGPTYSTGNGGVPRTLARLANPQSIAAPGGETDLAGAGVNLLGPPSGMYAGLRQSAAPPPIPTQADLPQASQAPPGARTAAPLTMGRVAQMEQSPHFQYQQPPSTKPDFYDNLIRFGLATMAAGGKPGSTLLGAIGEGGTAALDASQKAGQGDYENQIASKKLYFQGQDIINKRLEQAEMLQQRADAMKEGTETKRLALQQAADARASALSLQRELGQGRIEASQDRNDLMRQNNENNATTRQQNADTAAARQTETAQANADKFEGSYRKSLDSGVGGMMMTDGQKDMATLSRTAARHPNSTQAQAWTDRKTDIIADAKAAVAGGADRNKVLQRLQGFGLASRDLQ